MSERFNEWLRQRDEVARSVQPSAFSLQPSQPGSIAFNPDQLSWLQLIRDHIATTLSIEPEDFDYAPFSQRGGLGKAHELFGEKLPSLLEELNEVLAA